MHSEAPDVTITADNGTACDGTTRGNNMCSQHRWLVLLGVLLVMAGVVLVMFTPPYGFVIGIACIVCMGLFFLFHAFYKAVKSRHGLEGDAVPGHLLLHSRTGTCYTHHQATAVQRRLDRIRRATEEDNCHTVQLPPSTDTNQQSLPEILPPLQMEPPPSYETAMKTTTAITVTTAVTVDTM